MKRNSSTVFRRFCLEKIHVPNIYNEKFGLPFDMTNLDDLSVNIIYVEDGVRYFTYNPSIEIDSQNQILDPIVIVDTRNVDPSFYFSYLTNSCFFESTNINPLSELMPYVTEHNLTSVYDTVAPIFTLRAQGISSLTKEINMLLLIEAALSIGFIFSIYLFNACYFQQKKIRDIHKTTIRI